MPIIYGPYGFLAIVDKLYKVHVLKKKIRAGGGGGIKTKVVIKKQYGAYISFRKEISVGGHFELKFPIKQNIIECQENIVTLQ